MSRYLRAALALAVAVAACDRTRSPGDTTAEDSVAIPPASAAAVQPDTLGDSRAGVLLPNGRSGALFVIANLRDSLAMDPRVPLAPLLDGRANVADLSGRALRFAAVAAPRRDSLLHAAAQQECPAPIPVAMTTQSDSMWLLGLSPNVVTKLGGDTIAWSSPEWKRLAAELHPLLAEADPLQLRPELQGARYEIGRTLHFTYEDTEYAVVESMREVVDTTTGRVAEQAIVVASRRGDAQWKREWSTRFTGIGEFLNTARFSAWAKDPYARLLLIFETQSAKGGGGGILMRAAPQNWQDWLTWDAGC